MAKKTLKEKFDRMMGDPHFKESEAFKEAKKHCNSIDRLTADIVRPCLSYAADCGDEDGGWVYTILISLARATCKLTYALQKSIDEEGKNEDVFRFYHDEMLPLVKVISYRESSELEKCAEHKTGEAEDGSHGVSRKTKEKLIFALADPDMTADDIIDRFFKEGLSAEERQEIVGYIEKTRREKADELAKVMEIKRRRGS